MRGALVGRGNVSQSIILVIWLQQVTKRLVHLSFHLLQFCLRLLHEACQLRLQYFKSPLQLRLCGLNRRRLSLELLLRGLKRLLGEP